MMRLRLWAVVIGVLIEAAGGIALGVAMVTVLFLFQGQRGATGMELPAIALVLIELLMLVSAVIGGLVAARLASTDHVRHGLAVGVGACVVWLVVELVLWREERLAWTAAVGLLGAVPTGMLGGYLARRTQRGDGMRSA